MVRVVVAAFVSNAELLIRYSPCERFPTISLSRRRAENVRVPFLLASARKVQPMMEERLGLYEAQDFFHSG
jgi:hypothetical protein